jgi:uncharacterized protein (TIGR00251 family)
VSAPELALAVARDGLVVAVSAKPRARRDAIAGLRDGALLVETTAAPEDGAANEAIRRLLANALGIPRAQVTLTSGGASRRKRFKVAGLSPEYARARLLPLLAEPRDG